MSDAPRPAPPARRPTYPRWLWLVALAVVAVVAGAVAALVALSDTGSTTLGSTAIERVIPAPDAKILQQAEVGVDLAPGWEGRLTVNGTPVPDGQLDVTPGLNLVEFSPGPGKVVERFDAGQNCVIATYWRSSTGPAESTSRSWCFTVV